MDKFIPEVFSHNKLIIEFSLLIYIYIYIYHFTKKFDKQIFSKWYIFVRLFVKFPYEMIQKALIVPSFLWKIVYHLDLIKFRWRIQWLDISRSLRDLENEDVFINWSITLFFALFLRNVKIQVNYFGMFLLRTIYIIIS